MNFVQAMGSSFYHFVNMKSMKDRMDFLIIIMFAKLCSYNVLELLKKNMWSRCCRVQESTTVSTEAYDGN